APSCGGARAREHPPGGGGLAAWGLPTARGRASARLRAEGAAARFKAIATVADSGPELSLVPRDPAEQQQDRARVESALKQLPPEQRQVVEMAYYEGLSQREIALRTGDPLGTVKTRVRLGMEKLSRLLRDEGVPPS